MTEKRLVAVAAFFIMFAYIIELGMVQINISGKYGSKASEQQNRLFYIDDGRGIITDSQFNNITNTVTRYKTLVTAYDGDMQQLFNALTEEEKQKFYDNIQNKNNFMAELESPVEDRQVYAATQRYSDFNIAQHLIGYVDGEGNGVSGMEYVFDEELKNGSEIRCLQAEINGYGEIMSVKTERQINNDSGVPLLLSLTIDNTVQRICEGLAKEYIPNGSIIVMECETGKIKAMVSTPFYSANNLVQALEGENSPLVNKALQSYEAGSVIKPLWSAVLLENGYDIEKEYECTGVTEINGHEYHCANNTAHGMVDMEQALVVSCNCYFINAYTENKALDFYRTAKNLSFGEKIFLTKNYSSKAGSFPDIDQMQDLGQLANISFGQGEMLLTPVHIAAYMNIFASDGVYTVPQIAQGIYNADTKEVVKNLYSPEKRRIIAPKTAQQIKKMLKSVVEEGAMGRARPEYLSAGGKTGTAQTGRYSENGQEIFTAWFCGFYPYDNPKYTICVTICNGGESTRTAAPVFKKICDSLYYVLGKND